MIKSIGGNFVAVLKMNEVDLRATAFSAMQREYGGPFFIAIDFPLITGCEYLLKDCMQSVLSTDEIIHSIDVGYIDNVFQRFKNIRGVQSNFSIVHSDAINMSVVFTGEIDSPIPSSISSLTPKRIYTWADGIASIERHNETVIDSQQIRKIGVTIERNKYDIKESGFCSVLGSLADFSLLKPATVRMGLKAASGRFINMYEFTSEAPCFTQSSSANNGPLIETELNWQLNVPSDRQTIHKQL